MISEVFRPLVALDHLLIKEFLGGFRAIQYVPVFGDDISHWVTIGSKGCNQVEFLLFLGDLDLLGDLERFLGDLRSRRSSPRCRSRSPLPRSRLSTPRSLYVGMSGRLEICMPGRGAFQIERKKGFIQR